MKNITLDDIYDFCSTVCELIDENQRLKERNARLQESVERYQKNLHETVEFQKQSIANLLRLSMEKYQQEKTETKDLEAKDAQVETTIDPCSHCAYKNCSYVGESPCLNCEKIGKNALTVAIAHQNEKGVTVSVR